MINDGGVSYQSPYYLFVRIHKDQFHELLFKSTVAVRVISTGQFHI